jgi:hypothetical protein
MNTLYTVSKCRNKDNPDGTPHLYGPIHGSMDALKTVCGLELDWHWEVPNNTFDGTITCKRCFKSLSN